MNKNMIFNSLQKDLDIMIEEVKETVLKNVKERLILDLQDVLMELAVIQIEGRNMGETLGKETEFPVSCLELKPLYELSGQNYAPELASHDSFPEIVDNNSVADKIIYLFGITEIDACKLVAESELEGMTDGDGIYSICHENFLAVACQVPQDEFSDGKIQELTENCCWLADKAERHQKVITAVMQQYTVIPMRFCTLYHSSESVKIFLEENKVGLRELLNSLKGKVEWGLKLYLNEDLFKNWIKEKDESIRSLTDQVYQNDTGKGYFLKKKLENKIEEEIEQKAFDFAEEVHRQLSTIAVGAVLNKLMTKETTRRREKMILNGAYLLETGWEEQFIAEVNLIEEKAGDCFFFEISGPWPCYNFCRMPSKGF